MITAKIIYLILLICSVFFFILYKDIFALWVLVFAIVMPLLLKIVSLIIRFSLKAEFSATKLSQVKNQDFGFSVKLTNNCIFPVSNALITVDYYNSFDGKKQTVNMQIPIQQLNSQAITFKLSSQYCGKVVAVLRKITVFDYFRLSKTSFKPQLTAETIILPQTFPVDIVNDMSDLSDEESDVYSKVRAGDDCSEIFDIREYREGDRINRINWKLSTKQDKLLVKDYSLPIKSRIVLLFEFSYDANDKNYMQKLDALVETMVSISEELCENEILHKIVWYCDRKNTMISEKISDASDTAVFLGKLLKSSANVSADTLENYVKLEGENIVSHLFYITSALSSGWAGRISDLQNVRHKTVIYISDNPEQARQESIPDCEMIIASSEKTGATIGTLVV